MFGKLEMGHIKSSGVCVCVFSRQCLSRSAAVEIVNSSKVLQLETRMLLEGKLLVRCFYHFFLVLSKHTVIHTQTHTPIERKWWPFCAK